MLLDIAEEAVFADVIADDAVDLGVDAMTTTFARRRFSRFRWTHHLQMVVSKNQHALVSDSE